MTITPALATALAARLEAARPKRLLEFGSGNSTVILGDYASRTSGSLVSLENDPACHKQTTRLLTAFGLQDHVDLRLAPLKPWPVGDGGAFQFYDTELDGMFDFVLVDGPFWTIGREATFLAVFEHLAPGWELWLDDAYRRHERECVELWQRHFTFDASERELDHQADHKFQARGVPLDALRDRGLLILSATNAAAG